MRSLLPESRKLVRYLGKNFVLGFTLTALAAKEIVHFFKPRRAASTTEIDEQDRTPPAVAEFIAALCTKRRYRAAAIGDKAETFTQDCKDYGRKRAVRMYWADTIASVGPIAWHVLKRLGFVAFIVAAAKRMLP